MNRGWLIFLISIFLCQQAFSEQKFFSIKEIQMHQTANDCWIVVDAEVYDITKFINIHDDKCEKIKLSDLAERTLVLFGKRNRNQASLIKRRSTLEFESNRIGTLSNHGTTN